MLKKMLLAALAVGVVSTQASAALLLYEPFNYTTGQPIEGQVNPGSGNTWGAPTTGTAGDPVHSIATPGLTAPAGFATAVGNKADMVNTDTAQMNRISIPGSFTEGSPNFGVNSTLYYSTLLNVPSTAGLNTLNTNLNANNGLIIGFNNGLGTARPTNWAGQLTIRQGTLPNTYQLGVRATGTTANTTYWTGNLNAGDTQLIVVRYQQGANASSGTDDTNDIWVNPASSTFGLDELSRPAPDGSSDGALNSGSPGNNYAAALIIGAGISNTSTNQNPNNVYLDEIRVGTTWASVTPLVPEPGALALLGIGALGLLARRRRQA